MIHALHHITVAAPSVEDALSAYATLIGRNGTRGSTAIELANLRLEFMASQDGSEGLAQLAFATGDIEKARRLLANRALPVTPDARGLRIDPAATHQVPIALIAHKPDMPQSPPPMLAGHGAVTALDHVVIRTPDPERAIALYGGRFGLSLRLDRSEPAWGARMLFFRCGDLVIEVVHDTKGGTGATGGPDRLWGLSWRVGSVDKAQARLRAAGVDVSDIRVGRRPGSRVFTVRNGTIGVPTLMIGD